MPDPTQNNQNTQDPQTGAPSSDQTTPIVPTFQSADSSATPPMAQTSTQITTPTSTVTVKTEEPKPTEDQGSSAPNDLPPMSSSPKKKFGGGKIIATILGFLVLAGGIAGGVILTQQQQDIRERAGGGSCTRDSDCKSNQKCNSEGYCIPKGGCTSNNDCDKGQECGKNGSCVDKPDEDNAPACPAGESCSNSCAPGNGSNQTCQIGGALGRCCRPVTCPAGTNNCGGNCIDLQSDTKNCGGCNTTCASGTQCVAGKCTGGVVTGPDCNGVAAGQPCTGGADCHCQGGDLCTSTICEPNVRPSCEAQGRSWCNNVTGNGKTCCVPQYVCNPNGNGCVPRTSTNPPGQTPPPGSPTAQCINVKAYKGDSQTALTSAELNTLKAGDLVNFCVLGSATAADGGVGPAFPGSFDSAQFSINGSLKPVVNLNKSAASRGVCQPYTILPTDTTMNIRAKIHHATIGWVGENI